MSESNAEFDDDALMEAAENADCYLDATKPRDEHLECLKSTFGHSAFRPKQWDIIRTVIEDRRDVCVVMPTGYGKSLCFQFPSVFTNGITLVVSPLISLMQDQVLSLEVANIPACLLGSAQRNRNIDAEVLNGDYRLVYASPEYLTGERGKDLLRKLEKTLTLIAIDEAHCVSQWGHDFRPDYRRLSEIRGVVKKVPILAVTATATEKVRADIAESLRMHNTQFICMGFDRPNIDFSFRPKGDSAWDDLRPYTTNIRGSVIVYVMRKADAEQIAAVLQDHGVRCEYYHAGAALGKRQAILEDFTRDRLQVIVATVAFGMGIDKPDVRFVIHYGVSKNLETYYQEVGRAGRDGQPSKAVTFFDRKDFGFQQWLLTENHDRKSAATQQHLQELAQKMKEFCYTSRCRRAFIMEYFGASASHLEARSDCCDNCRRGVSTEKLSEKYQGIDDAGNYDFTESGRLFLSAMNLTSKASVAIGVLKGSMAKGSDKYKNDPLFGAGKLRPKGYWEAIQLQLRNDHMLTTKVLPAPYRPINVLSQQGSTWLRSGSKEPLVFKAIPEMFQFIPRKRKIPQIPINNNTLDAPSSTAQATTESREAETVVMNDNHLESILLSIRAALADSCNCMPFIVASNAAIAQMVKEKPASVKQFKSAIIDGFSVAKIEKFASAFVDGIVKFMQNEFCTEKIIKRCPMKCGKSILSSEMQTRLRELINKNSSLPQIAQATGLRDDAALAEIVILLRSGHSITKNHLMHLVGVDDGMFNHIATLAEPTDFHSLDAIDKIKAKFCANTKITEHMLVLVLNYLRVRQYLKLANIPYFDPDEDKLVNAESLLRKFGDQTPFDPNASTSSSAANDLAMNDGDEFTDEMIDKIFVDWSAKETKENVPNEIEPAGLVEHTEAASTSHAQANKAHDVSVELIDEDMIDDIFVEWDQDATKKTENEKPSTSIAHNTTEALHVSNAKQEIPQSSTSNVIQSTLTNNGPAAIEAKKPKVAAPRVYVRTKTQIKYCSDSDSEEENQPAPAKPQRPLPNWMAQRPASTALKNEESNAKRMKKASF